MSEVRQCWPVLVQKAQAQVDVQRTRVAQAWTVVQQRHDHWASIQRMLGEYRQRYMDTQRRDHSVSDTMNYRAFIGQLQTLSVRAEEEMVQAKVVHQQAQKAMAEAEKELRKMTKLTELDAERALSRERVQEQRRMDEMAVMRHQWRQA